MKLFCVVKKNKKRKQEKGLVVMAGSFEDYGLLPELCSAVLSMGWHLPTDIQAECIPLILGGGDVMAVC